MSRFPIHPLDTAPDASRPLLAGFLAAREIYQRVTLSGSEIQMLSLVAAYENECAWCMAFHSRLAEREGVSAAVIDALER